MSCNSLTGQQNQFRNRALLVCYSPNTCIYSWILKISISDENEMQKLQITHKKRFLQLLELFVIFLWTEQIYQKFYSYFGFVTCTMTHTDSVMVLLTSSFLPLIRNIRIPAADIWKVFSQKIWGNIGRSHQRWHKCFPVNFAKFIRKIFLQNTSARLLL